MTSPTARSRRTMVGALRLRAIVVVVIVLVLVGVASVLGVRLIADRIGERQLDLVTQTVASWLADDGAGTSISPDQLDELVPTGAVVALLDADGAVVALAAARPVSTADAARLAPPSGTTSRIELADHPFLARTIEFGAGTSFDDTTPIAAALVAVGVDGAERLVSTLVWVELGILAVAALAVGIAVTLVVGRTTGSLTRLATAVERGELQPAATGRRSDFAEVEDLAAALHRLDVRRRATEGELRSFLANASHELRTPLTKIQGWSELHFRTGGVGDSDRAFASIVEEAERMRALVDRLALLARADSDGPDRHGLVDLVAVCATVAEDVALIAPETTVSWGVPAEPVMVRGNEAELVQVLRNLVGNALVHGGGGVAIEVDLHARVDDGDSVVLVVADDGPGLDPAIADRAFERFVTGDRRTGTGLGLAIVRAIVLAHGGAVRLETSQDGGTSATVELPPA